MGRVRSLGAFLRDPSPYLRVFRRKTTENSERLGRQVRPGIEPGTSRLPVFERRTTLLLLGAKDGQFDIHALHRIRTGTFGAAAGFPYHYTT